MNNRILFYRGRLAIILRLSDCLSVFFNLIRTLVVAVLSRAAQNPKHSLVLHVVIQAKELADPNFKVKPNHVN